MPTRSAKDGKLIMEAENLSPARPSHAVDFSLPEGSKLAAQCRVTNRALYCRADYNEPSHYFAGAFSSDIYPDGFDPDNPHETGLLPGEHMNIPTAAAISLFGPIFADKAEASEKLDVIRKYGDYEYAELVGASGEPAGVGRSPKLQVVGIPAMPDVIVQQVDQRGRLIGGAVEILNFYLGKDNMFIKHKAKIDAAAAKPQKATAKAVA